ncbi:hypothetical protein [Mycobacterium arosiense]|nr:hypothetical protein [Mycobacterium arosiense]
MSDPCVTATMQIGARTDVAYRLITEHIRLTPQRLKPRAETD